MTEQLGVSCETIECLARLETLLLAENKRQNLISAATITSLWSRHFLDSLQLLPLGSSLGRWLDVGSGAGLPGLVLACAGRPMTLVDSRPLRTAFLKAAAASLCLDTEVVLADVRRFGHDPFDTICARAVARLDVLFDYCAHLATVRTIWVLPKGRQYRQELAEARERWTGEFEVVPSMTDPEARIIVARDVRRRGR